MKFPHVSQFISISEMMILSRFHAGFGYASNECIFYVNGSTLMSIDFRAVFSFMQLQMKSKYSVSPNGVYWSLCAMCKHATFHTRVGIWRTAMNAMKSMKIYPKPMINWILVLFLTNTALSWIVATTTTIFWANRWSRCSTPNAPRRVSFNDTDVNGIFILPSMCARLYSKLLRRSTTATDSGWLSNCTRSLALMRGQRSFCMSLSCKPEISYEIIEQTIMKIAFLSFTTWFKDITNSPGSVSCNTFLRYVTLFGVDKYIFCDLMTHVSITMSGRSENSKIHSLKHEFSRVVFNCWRMEIPMNSG